MIVRSHIPPLDETEIELERIRMRLSLSYTTARVLQKRGIRTEAQVQDFFTPKLACLTQPHGMADREAAIDRLAFAVTHRERVVVFGDYDVDGITSTAIITTVLDWLGVEVIPVLASRFDGGYGFSEAALKRVKSLSPSLLITCDCGTSDHDRLEAARAANIDVVVIDHHMVPDQPLPARAFLNPHRPDCAFPYKDLASCGLALSLAAGLRTRMNAKHLDVTSLLDLVALGTIADVVPLTGDNRIFASAGLERISRENGRPGLMVMKKLLNIAPNTPLSAEDVAFRFAPRLNAPGRLARPDPALELLRAPDEARALLLARELDALCLQRRAIEKEILIQALEQIKETRQETTPGIVVADTRWHAGVIGIVASRLVEKFDVPVVIVALEDGQSGRGSVRGPKGSRLYDTLSLCQEAMIGFGGHQAAAGVTIDPSNLEKLREMFSDACIKIHEQDSVASQVRMRSGIQVDAVIDPRDDIKRLLHELQRFEPCGAANPAPVLAVDGIVQTVSTPKSEHLRFTLQTQRERLECFAYSLASEAPLRGARVRVAGTLRHDSYRSPGSVVFRVSAIRSM